MWTPPFEAPLPNFRLAFTTPNSTAFTLYAGHLEIRNWMNGAGGGDPEQIFVTPIPNIRLAFTTPLSTAFTWTAVHHDGHPPPARPVC